MVKKIGWWFNTLGDIKSERWLQHRYSACDHVRTAQFLVRRAQFAVGRAQSM